MTDEIGQVPMSISAKDPTRFLTSGMIGTIVTSGLSKLSLVLSLMTPFFVGIREEMKNTEIFEFIPTFAIIRHLTTDIDRLLSIDLR